MKVIFLLNRKTEYVENHEIMLGKKERNLYDFVFEPLREE